MNNTQLVTHLRALARQVLVAAGAATLLADKTPQRVEAETHATAAWSQLLRATTTAYGHKNAKRVAIQEVANC